MSSSQLRCFSSSTLFFCKMPSYPGVSQVMEVDRVDDWQVQYAEYLADKEAKEFAEYEKAESQQLKAQNGEEWAIEYYKYVAEKEKALDEERS